MALLGTAAWVLLGKNRQITKEDQFELFCVKDTASIGKIFIADRAGRKALLQRKTTGWLYTDPDKNISYPVRPSNIKLLLESIALLRVRMGVNESAVQNVVRELGSTSNKVEIFSNSGTLLKTFYMGEMATNNAGSNAMLQGDDHPYVVFIPGFEGSLFPRFQATPKAWRDKAIVRLKPNAIQEIGMEYHSASNKKQSFKIQRSGNYFTVKPGIEGMAEQPEDQLDPLYVSDYLKLFEEFTTENPVYNDPYVDSLVLNSPIWCTFTMKTVDGKKVKASLYPYDSDFYKDPVSGEGGVRSRQGRYVILVERNEPASAIGGAPKVIYESYIHQQNAMNDYMVGYNYFFGKAGVQQAAPETKFKQ